MFHKCRSLKQRVMRRSDGKKILLQRYVSVHGKPLTLTNPQTFTEKLFYRMISWNQGGHNPIFTQLSDKYRVRDYVRSKVGEQHLVKLLWHGTNPSAIPFDTLPTEYVIKTNHASGHVIVVNGKADRADIIGQLSVWLKSNFYWVCREYQYYHIEPRIMIEDKLTNQDGRLVNYKFWCFAGVPEVIHISDYASTINSFFDAEWNHLDLHYRENVSRPVLAKPINFDQMLLLASQLSAGFDFVRVDLYNIEGKIYFGELTFTPMAGEMMLRPEAWDLKLGEKWKTSVSGNDLDQAI